MRTSKKKTFAIPFSDPSQIQEDGTIALSSEAQTRCEELAAHLLEKLDVAVTADQVAAASMIAVKMPQSQNLFWNALDWVLAHESTMQGEPIPREDITTMCQTDHLPDTVEYLYYPQKKIGLGDDGKPIIKSQMLRGWLEHRAKELTLSQGRPVTPYHLVVALLIGPKGWDRDLLEVLDWVIARQDMKCGSPIPLQEVKEAAEAEQLPILPPPLCIGENSAHAPMLTAQHLNFPPSASAVHDNEAAEVDKNMLPGLERVDEEVPRKFARRIDIRGVLLESIEARADSTIVLLNRA